MELQLNYQGPPIDDPELLDLVPESLAGLLRQVNGFIQFGGGLHVRGACRAPTWHSLRDAWTGADSFARLYQYVVGPDDIPFAEDCLGDQFLLRQGKVWQLSAETGDIDSLGVALGEFLECAQSGPVEFLSLQPLIDFQRDGGQLEPGRLLSAFPPFCVKPTNAGLSLKDVPALERRRFLADLASQLRNLPDGTPVNLRAIQNEPLP